MKIFKKFVATATAIAIASAISTVGFAMSNSASSTYELKYETSDLYTSGSDTLVDVEFFMVQNTGSDDLSKIEFQPDDYDTFNNVITFKTEYNKDNVSVVSGTSDYVTLDSNTFVNNTRKSVVTVTVESSEALSLTADKALAKITYKVLKTEEGTYSILKSFPQLTLSDCKSSVYVNNDANVSSENLTLPTATDIKYTIASAGSGSGSTDLSISDSNSDGVYEATNATDTIFEGKKLIFADITEGTITANTRVKVTNKVTNVTKQFGGNMGDLLAGNASLTASQVKFGLLFDDTESWTAANFTFELVNN